MSEGNTNEAALMRHLHASWRPVNLQSAERRKNGGYPALEHQVTVKRRSASNRYTQTCNEFMTDCAKTLHCVIQTVRNILGFFAQVCCTACTSFVSDDLASP